MSRPYFQPGQTYDFVIKRPVGRRRVEQYLRERISSPHSWARDLLEMGCVTLDGVPCRQGQEIVFRAGAVLRVRFPDPWPPHLRPVSLPLRILHEDEHLVAVDKPAGIVVHPARGHMGGYTLQNAILYRYRSEIGKPGVTLAAPHRLDRETSGVILFARQQRIYTLLCGIFQARQVHKEYLALIAGCPAFEATAVRAPLGVDPNDRSRGKVLPLHEGGKESHTDVYVLERGADWALVRAVPHTGRGHQIRLHLAYLGHPVLGDDLYAPPGQLPAACRLALHCSSLTFAHPADGRRTRLAADLPDDLAAMLARLRTAKPPCAPALYALHADRLVWQPRERAGGAI